ncbi:MAG: VanZ family protein, partial [Phycisphaeraceae bacterium]|nr:VanZ family protein [Phycisphaeraceae bacterium]
ISGLDEFHQRFVPGRFASWDDFCINVGAVVVFLLVARMVESYWASRPISPARA